PCHLLCCLLFTFQSYGDHRHLHSFPTRRSSDLIRTTTLFYSLPWLPASCWPCPICSKAGRKHWPCPKPFAWPTRTTACSSTSVRSEEHTSELQSREKLVCRLLLEKKKKTKQSDE